MPACIKKEAVRDKKTMVTFHDEMPQEGERAAMLLAQEVIVQNNAGTRMTIQAARRVGTICRVNLVNQAEKYENPDETIYWQIKIAWDIDGVVHESCDWISSENCEWWPYTVDAETVVAGSGQPFLPVAADELSEDEITGDEMPEDEMSED